MFPQVILDLIDRYVEAMDEGGDLPSLNAITKLIQRTDAFVLNNLAFVTGIPTSVMRQRYQITFHDNFVFFFRLSPMQRQRLCFLLRRGVVTNVHCSNLIWAFVVRDRPLAKYPEYKALFVRSLLCTMLARLDLPI